MSTAKTEVVLKVDGQKVPLAFQQILSLACSKEVNKVPTAGIILKDGEVDKQDFKISNQDYFIPGAKIEIWLGTPTQKDLLFKGMVTKHGIKVRKGKPSVLVVECKDEAVRLTIGRKSRFFNDISDSDIFQEIVKGYPALTVEAEDTTAAVVHGQIVQYFTSDWDFMAMRAEALGQYVFVSDGKITIRRPQLQTEPVFKLAYGVASDTQERSRIWELESEMDARYQFNNITSSSWDYSKQNLVEGMNSFSSNEPGNLSSNGLSEVIGLEDYQLHHQGRMYEGELNAYADAVKQKSILNKSFGRIKFDGRADILPGDMVSLEGVGDRFNGRVFVSRVHHRFEPGRWFTEIQFGLPYCWFHENRDIANPPALGLIPKIAGLQVGKVVQLKDDGDPDKDFRIKVRIPGFHRDEEGVWARVATLSASSDGKGMLFLPNVGDEVILGYIDQDAREPVVLGAVFSESNPPPFENDDNNYKKGIVTNNDHKIVIDEDKNLIQLETSGGCKMLLDDQNSKISLSKGQSSIELSSTEITISSPNIKMDAQMIDILGRVTTNINSPTGGLVKLGNGVKPATSAGDPSALVVVLPGPNVRVLI